MYLCLTHNCRKIKDYNNEDGKTLMSIYLSDTDEIKTVFSSTWFTAAHEGRSFNDFDV